MMVMKTFCSPVVRIFFSIRRSPRSQYTQGSVSRTNLAPPRRPPSEPLPVALDVAEDLRGRPGVLPPSAEAGLAGPGGVFSPEREVALHEVGDHILDRPVLVSRLPLQVLVDLLGEFDDEL